MGSCLFEQLIRKYFLSTKDTKFPIYLIDWSLKKEWLMKGKSYKSVLLLTALKKSELITEKSSLTHISSNTVCFSNLLWVWLNLNTVAYTCKNEQRQNHSIPGGLPRPC